MVKRKKPNALRFERLETRALLAAGLDSNHNAWLPEDANGSGDVTPLDALVVINEVAQSGRAVAVTSNSMADVNADGSVTPLDALMILNRISRVQLGGSEISGVPLEARIARLASDIENGTLPSNLDPATAVAMLEMLKTGQYPEVTNDLLNVGSGEDIVDDSSIDDNSIDDSSIDDSSIDDNSIDDSSIDDSSIDDSSIDDSSIDDSSIDDSSIDDSSIDDELLGATGIDQIMAGDDIDQIMAGDDIDQIMAGDDIDHIMGGDGIDELYGDADTDSLWGVLGNDMLDGGTGGDQLVGGEGLDLEVDTGDRFADGDTETDTDGDGYNNDHDYLDILYEVPGNPPAYADDASAAPIIAAVDSQVRNFLSISAADSGLRVRVQINDGTVTQPGRWGDRVTGVWRYLTPDKIQVWGKWSHPASDPSQVNLAVQWNYSGPPVTLDQIRSGDTAAYSNPANYSISRESRLYAGFLNGPGTFIGWLPGTPANFYFTAPNEQATGFPAPIEALAAALTSLPNFKNRGASFSGDFSTSPGLPGVQPVLDVMRTINRVTQEQTKVSGVIDL